jgi:PAS domain S-box-containing protein
MNQPHEAIQAGAAGPDFSTSEAVLGWIQEIAPYGVFTTDREMRVRSWNEWLAAHSGITLHEVIGRPLADLFPELVARRLIGHYARALDGEVSVLSTALHRYLVPIPLHRDGEPAMMLQTVRIAPVRSAGVVIGTITWIEDVTQREVQAAILQRQQELDRVLSAALGALLQSNDPGRDVAEIFPIVATSLGLDAFLSYVTEPDGCTLRLVSSSGISPKQRESLAHLTIQEDDRRAPAGPEPIPRTTAAHHRDLQALGLRVHCCFPLSIGDRVIGLVSFGSYARAEIPPADVIILARIARYVAIALDRTQREREAVAASRAKDDFLAALSHELRTPLNPVLLIASEAAGNPEFPAPAREAFRSIEKNAMLEARLIDDLLDLTRIEHGKIALEMQPFDAHAALRDALVTIQAEAEEKHLSLEVGLGAPASQIIGDSGRLQQVFWNVLKNAVKFTPPGGAITVSSWSDLRELFVCVRDSGIGMAPHELSRIFGAFVQGDHAGASRGHRFGGLGLGLAISRKLVELHSGRIDAESGGPGQGAVFTIVLPLLVAAPAGLDTAKLPDRGGHGPRTAAGGHDSGRILLVEDHEPTRTPLMRLLVRRGFRVVAVPSVKEALAAAAREPFDVVLSDIGLPDGDGFDLMKTLRERHHLRGIALTGYGMEEDVARGASAGFVAHLIKPISVTVLDRTLATVLPPRG